LKKIILNISIILISLLITLSCSNKYGGYEKSENNFYFKYLNIGEGKTTPKFGDYIVVDIAYKTINDSVFFSGTKKFKLTKPKFKGDIDYCFAMLTKNDSANFIINANDFFTKTINSKLPSFFNLQSDMLVSVKLLEIIDSKSYKKQKAEFLSWVEDFSEYEKLLLQHYIEGEQIAVSPSITGLYKLTKVKGNGVKVQKGDTIIVHYEGMFLNGKYFDSTIKRNAPFEFVYGTEWQVVKGLEEAIGKMSEGENAIFIMPSEIAFGKKGSSTGIIPPFTPVIFKVNILKIKKATKNLEKKQAQLN